MKSNDKAAVATLLNEVSSNDDLVHNIQGLWVVLSVDRVHNTLVYNHVRVWSGRL